MGHGSAVLVSGGRVTRALLLALCATAVLPPAGAWWLNARRVDTTAASVRGALAAAGAETDGQVVCGPGRLPDLDVSGSHVVHVAWITAAVIRPEAFGPAMPIDGWGRCLLMSDRWILSAGPNGAIDTPGDADVLSGDDIGVRR